MAVQLNIHTSYDLLNSTVRIDELVKQAAADGQHALAITDLNVMFGVQAFYHACTRHNIKPIIGMTVYVADGMGSVETILLAKNNAGYHALMKLSSKIQLKSMSVISTDMLKSYADDFVIIFHGLSSESHLTDAFDAYISHDSAAAGKKVYASPVRYMTPKNCRELKVLRAIDSNEKLDIASLNEEGQDYFKLQSELADMDADLLAATDEIAEMCNVTLGERLQKLPKFKTKNGMTSDDYLMTLIEKGKTQVADFNDEYEARLAYEYQVITDMGFSDYFLIVSDLIQFAKNKGILVGPGRGSSGGSLISYLLGITMIDPIEHDLIFERFLNPSRVTMPDIDIDFEDSRREEVIQYCKDKYGAFNVAGIVTFGHLLARAVMRDVGRILKFSDSDLKLASHLVPKRLGVTLEDALKDPEFQRFMNQDAAHKTWLEIALQLEGLPRHTSTHAAGVIIHDHLLTDYVPLLKGDELNLTQWTMTEVEALGLLKIDFLGLRNLSIIQRIVKKAAQGITTDNVDYTDAAVYERLSQADTTGIFQLESEGMKNVLKNLQPQNFEDIVAVLSLYRPGPMEQIPVYIERRHGEKVEYLHPDLEPILSKTYGVIIYQEQIMQIASEFAGFTLGEADNLRRAMSKKQRDVLEREREHFISGSMQKGYAEETAVAIYDLILKFADYGFPRAHAVAYAQIAYVMMYLKVHYPAYFYASLMSNVVSSEEKLGQLVAELKRAGIPYTGPSINTSGWYFSVQADAILMSLGMVKGAGYRTVMEIVEARKQGRFTDIYDFVHRMPKRVVTRSTLEALIMVGAFDEFGETRATLLASLDDILAGEQGETDDSFLEELGLSLKKRYTQRPEMSDEQKAKFEYQHLGFFLTDHPAMQVQKAHQFLPLFPIAAGKNQQWMLGMITAFKEIRTKKGQLMAFMTVTDGISELELVVFPDVYQKVMDQLHIDDLITFKGKFEGHSKMLVSHVQPFEQFKSDYIQNISAVYVLKKPDIALDDGEIPLYFYDIKEETQQELGRISKHMATSLLEAYPPEFIRII